MVFQYVSIASPGHPSSIPSFGNNSPHLRRLQCHLRLLPCLGFSRPHSLRLSFFRCRCFNRFRQGLRLEVDSWDQGKIKFISYFISFTWITTAMLLWWNDDNCYGEKNRGEVLHWDHGWPKNKLNLRYINPRSSPGGTFHFQPYPDAGWLIQILESRFCC